MMIQVKRGEGQQYGPTHWVEQGSIRALCGVIVRGSKPVAYVAANHCRRCNQVWLARNRCRSGN